ncbi:MAG: hypothetical protein AB2L07_09750 [Thermoanaerobaculaceae bacterium]
MLQDLHAGRLERGAVDGVAGQCRRHLVVHLLPHHVVRRVLGEEVVDDGQDLVLLRLRRAHVAELAVDAELDELAGVLAVHEMPAETRGDAAGASGDGEAGGGDEQHGEADEQRVVPPAVGRAGFGGLGFHLRSPFRRDRLPRPRHPRWGPGVAAFLPQCEEV